MISKKLDVHDVELKNSSTVNPCKLCAPLGASLAFKGINKAMTILHGSQGCATYIRRYLISHFREPVDIASSSFDESTAVFGGRDKLFSSIQNVCSQYHPEVIGIATTCLSETIGDDVEMYIKEYRETYPDAPLLVPVSTPSYSGSHIEGFRKTVKAIVETFACKSPNENRINIFPSIISPAEIRYLKKTLSDFGLKGSVFPDYSETLDGGMWSEYLPLPPGGTHPEEIAKAPGAKASIEFSGTYMDETAGSYLHEKFNKALYQIYLPIGIENCDSFYDLLSEISDHEMPESYEITRSRLVDAYADGHKYLFGKKVALYGDRETVFALTGFCRDLGMLPVICMTGEKSKAFSYEIEKIYPDGKEKNIRVESGVDFLGLEEAADELKPDIIIGSSKGAKIARKLDIPLIRFGFPVHDRFGASRQMYLGYEGTQVLLDNIINALLDKRQSDSEIVYTYL